MSGTLIIASLLRAHAPLLAVVPVARIAEGPLKSGTVPALSLDQISSVDHRLLDEEVPIFTIDRVQVTVAANNAPERRQLLALVRKACAGKRGNLFGFTGVSVLTDGQGPNFYNEQGAIFMRTQDFLVAFNRADD